MYVKYKKLINILRLDSYGQFHTCFAADVINTNLFLNQVFTRKLIIKIY